jgi:hypothetical protein
VKLLRVKPAGSVPENDTLAPPNPPVDAQVLVYVCPTATGPVLGVQVIANCGATGLSDDPKEELATCAVGRLLSVTVRTKGRGPVAVGVPLKTTVVPLVWFITIPAGNGFPESAKW